MNNISKTNWDKIDALEDKDIDTSDIPPLNENFFAKATLRKSEHKVPITVDVDSDILDWFKAQGGEYQKWMNAALRIYFEAHRDLNK
jgi:uncharacterized protein (DUF4415 family)